MPRVEWLRLNEQHKKAPLLTVSKSGAFRIITQTEVIELSWQAQHINIITRYLGL